MHIKLRSKILSYLTLYGAHALKVFSFIILIPHFTSIFPKEIWGSILLVQSLSLWLQILVEYGFNLSATRSMSRVRDDRLALGHLVAGVAGAKIILSLLAALLAVFAVLEVDNFKPFKEIVVWATLAAITQGFNPVWYFLAREKFGQYAVIDFFSRLTYLFACLFFIKNNGQEHLIFIFGIFTAMITNFVGYLLISRQIPLYFPNLRGSIQALRDGFSMFIFVGITSVYTTLNIVILGFSQTPVVIAAYGTSDRIVRAAGGLLDPLNRIIYAKLSHLYHSDFKSALVFLRRAASILFFAGIIIFLVGQIYATSILKILASNYVSDAISYLRILLFFIPILAINNIIGLHIMLPLGLDKEFNTIFIIVSIISVLAMLIFTPSYGGLGMGVIIVLTEVLACLGMAFAIWRTKILKGRT